MVEPRVGIRVDVLRAELLDERPPRRPPYARRKQALLLGNAKVALVGDARDVGEEEAERTLPEATALAFPRGPSVDGIIVHGAAACPPTAEIVRPEVRLEQEARDGLQKNPARGPDEMHVHLPPDQDLSTEQELVV